MAYSRKGKAKLKIKTFLGIKIPIKKKTYWCKYGPVIKNKSGYFSFIPTHYLIFRQ